MIPAHEGLPCVRLGVLWLELTGADNGTRAMLWRNINNTGLITTEIVSIRTRIIIRNRNSVHELLQIALS